MQPKVIMNKIKEWVWFKTPLRGFALHLRDNVFNDPNEHRWIRKILFSPVNIPYYDLFDFYMNEDMALWIVRTISTERGLAKLFSERYPHCDITPNCQYDGHWLKRYAAEYLRLPDDWEEKRAQTKEYKDWVNKTAAQIKKAIEDSKNNNKQ